MIRYVLDVLFGIGIVAGLARLTVDLLSRVYKEGYERGRKEASDWWTQVAKDVDQMQQPSQDEERWP
jgi:hypothetical protein